MRTSSLEIFVLTVGLGLVGCGGSDAGGPGPQVGDQGVGGSTDVGGSSGVNGGSSSVGGSTLVAGTANSGGSVTGGSGAAVGGSNLGTGGGIGVGGTGGSPATGGSNAAVGGNPSTGGSPATGGSKTGGGATGGTLFAGGMSSVGGAKATGGMAPTTGGTPAMGGTPATGGAKSTGGMAATGGVKATGGMVANGGTSSPPPPNKFCGNITTNNSVDTGGMKFSKYWDQITPENAGKWGSVQSSATGAFNWGTLDAIYSYTNTNSIIFKQHTFVWGSQQPSGTPTQAQVENWIKSFCQRYPNTKVIDVVNEPPPHTTPNYTANLGAGETGTYGWITKAFKLARQYCGSAVLLLNDYNNAEYTDQRNHYIDIVNQVKSAGGPIDAVGCQSHDFADISTATIQTNLAYLNSQTGLPIYITEYDVSRTDDTQQLNIYKDQFPFFLNTSYIHGITVWGWIYGSTWSQAPYSGMVRGTAPRSAMTWLMGQLGRPVPPN